MYHNFLVLTLQVSNADWQDKYKLNKKNTWTSIAIVQFHPLWLKAHIRPKELIKDFLPVLWRSTVLRNCYSQLKICLRDTYKYHVGITLQKKSKCSIKSSGKVIKTNKWRNLPSKYLWALASSSFSFESAYLIYACTPLLASCSGAFIR